MRGQAGMGGGGGGGYEAGEGGGLEAGAACHGDQGLVDRVDGQLESLEGVCAQGGLDIVRPKSDLCRHAEAVDGRSRFANAVFDDSAVRQLEFHSPFRFKAKAPECSARRHGEERACIDEGVKFPFRADAGIRDSHRNTE